MIQLDHTIISSDIEKEFFVCDLEKCKGACCVEGDLGAPLEEEELDEIDKVLEIVKPYLPAEAVQVLEVEGGYVIDEEGDFSTTTINRKECAFAFYDQTGILKCGIEQAWKDGKTSFQKPISCHLYPIRVKKIGEYEALNYDRWSICSPACGHGKRLGVPVYKFLKSALIRKFGEEWYQSLQDYIGSTKTP
ncbi:MAG: DUF3109 family protein [Cyclobacteriaceae bacterium]|nr:DUF3109 family protein [Cyclobacteriaceae bacterium HetDA_MAG_MS6]